MHSSKVRYLRPSSFSAFAPLLTIALFGPIASSSAVLSTGGKLDLSFSLPELDRSHSVNWPLANGPAETMYRSPAACSFVSARTCASATSRTSTQLPAEVVSDEASGAGG